MKNMGSALREKRRVLGLSQEELAHLLGVCSETISRWEREKRKPRSKVIRRAVQKFLEERKSRRE